jgi:hypothetical protein
MNHLHTRLLEAAVIMAGGLFSVVPALAAENPAVQQLVQMYSQQTNDPVEVAELLLKAAKNAASDPVLQRDLSASAYEHAMRKRDGGARAVEAATAVLRVERGHRSDWLAKLTDAYRVQYRYADAGAKAEMAGPFAATLVRAGRCALDEDNDYVEAGKSFREARVLAFHHKLDASARISGWVKVAASAQRVGGRIRQAEAQLERNADDPAARETLAKLLLTEWDRPAEAARWLGPGVADETWRRMAPLAAADVATLTDDHLFELAAWYGTLAPTATDLGKPRVLVRAIDYYERFCAKHTDADAKRLTALAGLAMSRKQLREFEWYGRAGTIRVVADDRFILRLNGEHVVNNKRNCQACEAPVTLKPGDVLLAKAWDVLPPSKSFGLSFFNDVDQPLFSADATWRVTSPTDAKQWWVFEPSDADPPCKVIRSPDRIWGAGKTCYLYKIVTVQDLRPTDGPVEP